MAKSSVCLKYLIQYDIVLINNLNKRLQITTRNSITEKLHDLVR